MDRIKSRKNILSMTGNCKLKSNDKIIKGLKKLNGGSEHLLFRSIKLMFSIKNLDGLQKEVELLNALSFQLEADNEIVIGSVITITAVDECPHNGSNNIKIKNLIELENEISLAFPFIEFILFDDYMLKAGKCYIKKEEKNYGY